MYTLPQSLSIALLTVAIFVSGLSADRLNAQNSAPEPMATLTPDEKSWLARHPEIVLGTTTEYSPMAIKRVDGTYAGVLLDIYEQLSRRLDTRIRLHIEDPWADVQAKAQKRGIDGLAMGGRDPNRERFFNATDVLIPT